MNGDGLSKIKKDYFAQCCSTEFDSELNELYALQINDEKTMQILDKTVCRISPISHFHDNEWTVIVFSETFFSNQLALDSKSIDKILLC